MVGNYTPKIIQSENNEKEKEKRLEFLFRKAILNAKNTVIKGKTFKVYKIENLVIQTPFDSWKQDGIHCFKATAEFFFVPINGVYISSGDRLNFCGKINKQGECFNLLETIRITDAVNTINLEQAKNE